MGKLGNICIQKTIAGFVQFDGAEGTVDAMVNCLGGHFEYVTVTGPMGESVLAKFGILENGSVVLEIAAASGLQLVHHDKKDIMKATTYGTSKYAVKYSVSVIAVVGCTGYGANILYNHGIDTIESCVYEPTTLSKALANAAANVEDAAERIMRAVRIGMQLK